MSGPRPRGAAGSDTVRARAAVHQARAALDAVRAEHEAVVRGAVQERYEGLRAESEARIAAIEQDARAMRETTQAQMNTARTHLHTAREGVKDARNRYERAKAELEAGLHGKLDENITAIAAIGSMWHVMRWVSSRERVRAGPGR